MKTITGEEITSYSDGLGFALTNPIFTSPTGFTWNRSWTSEQRFWREYMKEGIIFEQHRYQDVEEAYQKNKKNYSIRKTLFNSMTTDDLMIELLKIKLLTFPKLVIEIKVRGGLTYLENCTHQPTKQNSHWETGGDNGFIKALVTAYLNITNNEIE